MILNKEKITDCVHLSTIQTDKFKSSVISFSMTLPLTKERYAHNLLLSHILRRGTKKYPSTALLNKRLDELYGSFVEVKNHRIAENISLTLNAEILDNSFIPDGTDVLGGVIETVADIILSPIFLSDDFNLAFFEQEKKLICDSINAEINDTRVYAAKRCAEIMQEEIELPTSQELKELVSNASIESMLDYYHYLISHAPINIFYIGSQSEEDVKSKIALAFSSYPCKAASPLIFPRPIARATAVERTEEMSVSQGKLSLAFSLGTSISKNDNSCYTAIMLNEILGGSASSKFFLNVREKLGICYYCSSSISIYSGIMLIASGFEVSNYELARGAILEQIANMQKGDISDAEFYAARRSVASSYRQLYDSPLDMQAFCGDRALFGITDSIDDAIAKLLAVSKDDIITLAQNMKLGASYFVKGTLTASNNSEDEDEEEQYE